MSIVSFVVTEDSSLLVKDSRAQFEGTYGKWTVVQMELRARTAAVAPRPSAAKVQAQPRVSE
jgi:hypothetical protein